MDPDAIIALTLILGFFAFVYSLIRMKHRHEMAKLDRIAQGNADRSLTTSELETMVREIVDEATGPLKAQIKELAQAVNQPSSNLDLDADLSADADQRTITEKTLGRRERS